MIGRTLCFLTLVAVAFGQAVIDFKPYDKTAASMFEIEDVNHDGNLTRKEVDHSFVKFDFNGDKVIERLEYTCYQFHVHPALGSFANALFDEYDSNHDHHLQVQDLNHFYHQMDVNKDHAVDQAEFVAYWTMLFTKYEDYHIKGNPHPQHEPKACDHIHNHLG